MAYLGIKEFPVYDLHPAYKHAPVGDYVLLHPSVEISELSQTAIELLGYVFRNMEAGQVRLNVEELTEKYKKVSRTSVYQGITMLLQKEILFRKDRDNYWVNQSKVAK